MSDANLVAIFKEEQRFLFTFDHDVDSLREVRRQACAWANDPELCFTWQDAARVGQRAGQLFRETEQALTDLLLILNAHQFPPQSDAPYRHFKVDGWLIVLFYRGGQLDHLYEAITPQGQNLDPWEMNSPSSNALKKWRGHVVS